MNTRTARLLRLGILAARDPERMQYVHLAHPVVRKAARREAENEYWRSEEQRLIAMKAERTRPDDWDGYSMPQRVLISIDPATITAEQAEHLRRFYA